MKLTINRKSLLDVLKRIIGAVDAKPVLPIRGNILIQCDKNATFTACNSELRVSVSSDATVLDAGACTVPAKKLKAVVSSIRSDEITIETLDPTYNVKIGSKSSQITLLGMPPANYPEEIFVDPVAEFSVKASQLKDMIAKVIYASSMDNSRRVLTGMLLQVHDKIITAVATDGKRLAIQEYATTVDNINGVVIPRESAHFLKNILSQNDECLVKISKQACSFTSESFVFTTKLIEGNFPDYQKVIPKSFSGQITIPVYECIQKTEAVRLMLSDSSESVNLAFEGNKLTISACSAMVGDGMDSMEVKYEGENIDINVVPIFWLDLLKNIGTELVTLNFNDDRSPLQCLGPEGFMYIFMPMKKKVED